MGRRLIGTANHVYPDGFVGKIDISFTVDGHSWVSIGDPDAGNDLVIKSASQWDQVDAFVRQGLLDGPKE